MRRPLGMALLLLATLATGTSQSQFAGKWQSRLSRVTKKPAITVNFVEHDQELAGIVVLVNPPDGSEVEGPILNVKASGNVIKFESTVSGDIFYWNLTLKKSGSNRALLHGSCREMLIDESVKRH